MMIQELTEAPIVEFGHPRSIAYTPVKEAFLTLPSVPTGSVSQTTVTPSLNEYRLVSLGMLLAQRLANTLEEIRAFNEQAIYPIIAILEPFTEITSLDLRLPPISSNKVILNVIDRGRAKSNLSLP